MLGSAEGRGALGARLQRGLTRWSRPSIRPLIAEDEVGLLDLLHVDPVTHLFALEHYHRLGLPAPSLLTRARGASPFLGIFETGPEGPQMTGAFWCGSNLVPLHIPASRSRAVASYVAARSRQLSSVFGPAEQVMSLWTHLEAEAPEPFDLRPDQPLLELGGPDGARGPDTLKRLRELAAAAEPRLRQEGLTDVRWARPSEAAPYLRAAAAMFTEEVGYSPLAREPETYARRVEEGIRQGRSLLALGPYAEVLFKADLGLRAEGICQLQGVWLHPRLRGAGLSAPLLAQACLLTAARHERISLYVNAYNRPARALYRRLCFEQVGTFATILF